MSKKKNQHQLLFDLIDKDHYNNDNEDKDEDNNYSNDEDEDNNYSDNDNDFNEGDKKNEIKMMTFFDNPAQVLRGFFSAHYHEHGSIWFITFSSQFIITAAYKC